jgi:hypothetical protein
MTIISRRREYGEIYASRPGAFWGTSVPIYLHDLETSHLGRENF